MEREYNALSVGFQRLVSLGEYCHIRFKRNSKEHYRGDNELGRKAQKMDMPHIQWYKPDLNQSVGLKVGCLPSIECHGGGKGHQVCNLAL
jgi:hypothetical protein